LHTVISNEDQILVLS